MDKTKSALFEKLRMSRDLSDMDVRETSMDIYSEAYDILKSDIDRLIELCNNGEFGWEPVHYRNFKNIKEYYGE